jgi:hypothetical protein
MSLFGEDFPDWKPVSSVAGIGWLGMLATVAWLVRRIWRNAKAEG